MIDGLSHLLTLRKSGLRPAAVMLSIGVPYVQPKYSQEFHYMELVAHDSVALDDFRAFKGLEVTFFVCEWNDLATECLEKLKQYASEISILCADYGEDLGYFWSAEYGDLEHGQIHWLKQFKEATRSICRTEKEINERLRLESEAAFHIPNIQEIINGAIPR